MKIVQIVNGIVHWDATARHPTIESTEGKYPPSVMFVEAPDNVFEGWFFDDTKIGDERFVQPTPPEGWLYDDKTGTFYNEAEPTNEPDTTLADLIESAIDHEVRLTIIELGGNE